MIIPGRKHALKHDRLTYRLRGCHLHRAVVPVQVRQDAAIRRRRYRQANVIIIGKEEAVVVTVVFFRQQTSARLPDREMVH